MTHAHRSLVPLARASMVRVALALTASLATLTMESHSQPSQQPLLVNTSGARPNLMVTLDNSGSMAFPYADGYSMYDNGEKGTDVFAAQRSAEFNSLYYNPRITYRPRVDAQGRDLVPTDGIEFISNQSSAKFNYAVFSPANKTLDELTPLIIKHSSFEMVTAETPAGYQLAYSYPWDPRDPGIDYIPYHRAYREGQPNLSNDPIEPFTYAVCTPLSGIAGCKNARLVTVDRKTTGAIPLPANSQRTDRGCTKDQCTAEAERTNIMNWYRYYLTRMAATQTALGLAFNDKRLDNTLRIGYLRINFPDVAIALSPGTDVTRERVLRGVRPWSPGSSANQQFYDWLYGTVPMGGTPLHNSVNQVANYLRVPAGAKENPWTGNPARPADSDNPELACRRSYHVLFSDGAWSTDDAIKTQAATDDDNSTGPEFSRFPQTTGDDNEPGTLKYEPKGIDIRRKWYTPFPSTGTRGLADLTAKYHWHLDLRPELNNQVATRAGQPAFWQNMTTYTVGYLISPSGSNGAGGLTFKQIDQYRFDYLLKGFDDSAKPSWPGEDLSQDTDSGIASRRIDDFIHAGYTGGGRGFSVRSADDIKTVINNIVSAILSAMGDDAGVAVGGAGEVSPGLQGQLKYHVEYSTADGEGDIKASVIDETGHAQTLAMDAGGRPLKAPDNKTYWSASKQLPAPANRRIFSIRTDNTGFEFKGLLDSLPLATREALKRDDHDQRVPDDSRFVDYLRGVDPVLDAKDRPLRLRLSGMGAIVNSPPLLTDNTAAYMGYDLYGDVDGKSTYAGFRERVENAPDALVAATNAGLVHLLDANKGGELGAFIPRRSMARLIGQADPDAPFRYVLDGPVTLHDVYHEGAWKQIATGTGGRGERLIYSLNIPLNGAQPRTPSASDFLWETGPDVVNTESFALGHMTTPIRSGQTDGGAWVMVTTTGHHNGVADGKNHGLLVLDAANGAVLRRLTLPSDYSAGRGMGAVNLVRDQHQRIVAAYAGDANGQVWRFDLRGDSAQWRVAYGKPLFVTEHRRPVYGGPAWQAHPRGGYIVVVGTGMLLDDGDLAAAKDPESLYGIWDTTPRSKSSDGLGFEPILPSQLLEQTVESLVTADGQKNYFSISQRVINWTHHRGWKLALGKAAPGERVIDQIVNISTSVSIPVVAIDRAQRSTETCAADSAPPSQNYVLNALDGRGKPAFDIDGDGKLEPVAMVQVLSGGYSRGLSYGLSSPSSDATAKESVYRLNLGAQGGSQIDPNNPDNPLGCKDTKLTVYGTQEGKLDLDLKCNKGRLWSRQQYQLSQVPQ
jgi:type IV pilus assembly protein PilY1